MWPFKKRKNDLELDIPKAIGEIHHGACLSCGNRSKPSICENCYIKTRNAGHKDKCTLHEGKQVVWAGSNCYIDCSFDGHQLDKCFNIKES